MSEIVLDRLPERSSQTFQYGGFWPRTGALLLDTLITSPLGVLIFVNILYWKSLPLFLVLSLAQMAYKPLMEYYYGATLGKKVANLQVVDRNYGKASLQQILLRNIFNIIIALLSIVGATMIFVHPDFDSHTSFLGYSTFANEFTINKSVNIISFVTVLIDVIVLLSDKQKRTLHDKIAGTLVLSVKKEEDQW